MSRIHRILRLGASAAATVLVTGAAVAITAPQALAAITTTAWQNGRTDNTSFLSTNYPVMSGAARFLLAYATTGPDGLLHTTANAHETQWNVTDPWSTTCSSPPRPRAPHR